MPIAHPSHTLLSAPYADLVQLLLKQFKRLLAEQGHTLTSTELDAIAQAAQMRQPLPAQAVALIAPLEALVEESRSYLKERFGFSFAQSLATDMSAIGGWETTEEFLEIANHKSNHELRLSAGATLLLMLNNPRYAWALFDVLEADGGAEDVDAMLARRALCHACDIDPHSRDWLAQAQAWWRDPLTCASIPKRKTKPDAS